MAMPHRRDPSKQWKVAATAGKLVAQGVIEARDIVPGLLRDAVQAGFTGDLLGLQARLYWQVSDTADHWSQVRDRVEWDIRRAITPMAEAWADFTDIAATACSINDKAGGPLLSMEVGAVVDETLQGALARHRRTLKQGRRRHVR